MTAFVTETQEATATLRETILAMAFNAELMAGTLAPERFTAYVVQDALYLVRFARALSLAASMAPDTEAMTVWGGSAQGAIAVEQSMHAEMLAAFGVASDDVHRAEPSPACEGYTNFLLASAVTGGYPVLAAAVLPCFTVYWEVGQHVAASSAPDNPYARWIATYADTAFGEAVERASWTVDRAAAVATEATRAAMHKAFTRSTQYEWMFWDSAHRLEAWPVG